MRDEHRKARARYLIETDYGRQSAFVTATKISKSRVSQALSESQPFGEDAAITWEAAAGLPEGWFNNTWPTPKEARDLGIPVNAPYPGAPEEEPTTPPAPSTTKRTHVVDDSQWALLQDFEILPDDEKEAIRATLKHKAEQVRKIFDHFRQKHGIKTSVPDARVEEAYGAPPAPRKK